jgi:thymidylate synthase (FAD)
MTKLIWNPTVFVMGQTQFNPAALNNWARFNGLGDHVNGGFDSPLGRLWDDVRDEYAIERMIEFGGRHCYRAWTAGRDRGAYIRNIIEMDHGSVLEHSTVNLAIQGVSRSLSLELLRHRVGASPSQESQRFVDATDIKFVVPPIVAYLSGNNGPNSNADAIVEFARVCERARAAYITLQQSIVEEVGRRGKSLKDTTVITKRANEAARAHLPNSCETRLLWTANMRALRHIFWLRGGNGADLEIRRLALEMYQVVRRTAPSVFADMQISKEDGSYGVPIIVASNA